MGASAFFISFVHRLRTTHFVSVFFNHSKYILFCFSVIFKNDSCVFGKKRSFLKTTHSFWKFRKRITIVFENDHFFKNDKRPFFIQLFFFTKRSLTKGCLLSHILKKVVGELKLLDIFFKTTQWQVPMPFRLVSSLLLSSFLKRFPLKNDLFVFSSSFL